MEKLNYSIGNGLSHQALITASELLLKSAKRDVDLLSSEGVTPELLTQFETKLTTLKDDKATYGTDLADRKDSTMQRDAKSVELVDFIERLRAQLRMIYSKKTGKNSAIFSQGLSTLDSVQLIKIAEETTVLLQNNADEVAIYGVTPEKLAQLITLVGEFSTLHITQSEKVKGLNNYTEDRIELRAGVYQILEYISGVGKSYWKRNKTSRYDDYVIRKLKASAQVVVNEAEAATEEATSLASF